MKKFLILATLMFSAFFATTAMAQTNFDKSKNDYIVLTNNIEQLIPVLITAQKLKAEDGKKFGEFQVVVCGKTVENLADAEKMKPLLEMAEKAHVQLIACGFSLIKFNVDAAKIPTSFKVVENGILYDFQLQKKGFYSLSL